MMASPRAPPEGTTLTASEIDVIDHIVVKFPDFGTKPKGAVRRLAGFWESRMKAGKRSATPMTIQPYRGVDQRPMSTKPSKLSKKAERSVAAPLKKTAGDSTTQVAQKAAKTS
jgi:hypothetical protein